MKTAFSSARQLGSAFLALIVIPALSGCVVLPSTPEGPWKEELKGELREKSMVDAKSVLGEPTQTIELPDVTYYFYMGKGTQKFIILAHPLLTALSLGSGEVIMPIHPGEEEISQCLMLEVQDQKIVRAEIKSTGKVWDFRVQNTCPPLFWEMEELRQISARADQYEQAKLARRAEGGDQEASLAIARKYRELKFLKTIAARGDRELVFLLAREFSDTELLYQLAKAGDVEAATMLAQKQHDRKPLYMLAYMGNVEAAAALAESFGEHDMLKSLADGGNPDAVAAYQRISCEKIFYAEETVVRSRSSNGIVLECNRGRRSR